MLSRRPAGLRRNRPSGASGRHRQAGLVAGGRLTPQRGLQDAPPGHLSEEKRVAVTDAGCYRAPHKHVGIMTHSSSAFTRLELLVTLVFMLLLGVLAFPLFAAPRADSSRAACHNNLRLIGQAVALWGNDHDNLPPWLVRAGAGGTFPETGSKTALAWLEFISFSNQMVSPRLLACPADRTAKVASSWGNAAGGLANTGFRNNAVSYFIDFHSDPSLPRTVLTGDRDFNPTTLPPTSCSRGVNNAASIQFYVGVPVAWTNAVHTGAGHLLATDGCVDFVPSSQLLSRLSGQESQIDNGNIHVVFPR